MKICRARSLPGKCQLSPPTHGSLFHCFKQTGEPPRCSRSGLGPAVLVSHGESPVTRTGQSSGSAGVREVRHSLAQSLDGHTRIETTALPLMKRILHHQSSGAQLIWLGTPHTLFQWWQKGTHPPAAQRLENTEASWPMKGPF